METKTGDYYYRARYYSPVQGRFLTEDPIGFESGDTNYYRYVFNNPLLYTDPYGNFAWGRVVDVIIKQVFKRSYRKGVEFLSDIDPFGVPNAGKNSDKVPGYPKPSCNPELQSCAPIPNPVPAPPNKCTN